MESILLNGRYTAAEAEKLMTELFKVKTDFHMAKINTLDLMEEDIAHSEKRILELERELRKIKDLISKGDYKHIALRASIKLEYCPDYHNATVA
jgi:cob(I)alamin adenosyltransferase